MFIACSSWAGKPEEEHRESLVAAKHKQRCQSKTGDLLEAEEEMYELELLVMKIIEQS